MNAPASTRPPAEGPLPAEPVHLRVTTQVLPADDVSLGKVLPAVPAADVVAWVRRREGMVGWGRAASVTVTQDADRWRTLSAWWRAVVERAEISGPDGGAGPDSSAGPDGGAGPGRGAAAGEHSGDRAAALPRGAGLVAFASASFRDDSPVGSTLVVPEVVVGLKGDVAWVTHIEAVETVERVVDGIPVRQDAGPEAPRGVVEGPGETPDVDWPRVVQRGVEAIQQGRAQKIVLARDVVATAQEPLDVRWLLRQLVAAYPDTWTFAVDGLVGATPEMLVRLDGGHVFSRVLAGTASRAADVEDDQHAADALLASRKDLSEHAFAVDSVVERLSPLCSAVVAPRSPALLTLPNVFHLVSDLDGRAVPGTTVLELAGALHPSAAVGGTPREVAFDLIDELEGRDRGRYASPVGWMDARGDGDMGIALRTGQVDPDDPRRLRMWAGGGIVAESDPQAEYAETGAKLAPMRTALASD